MKQSDIQHLLDATKSLREARLSISRMSAEGRGNLQNSELVAEIISLEDSIGNQWLDARRAAAELGRKGGLSTSDAKKKSSANNGKLGGRPKKIKE